MPALALAVASAVAVRGDHVDYDVYVRAGLRVLHGEGVYDTQGELPFTYPPFAALLAVGAAVVPVLGLAVVSALAVLAAAWPSAHLLSRGGWTRGGIGAFAGLAVCSEPVLRTLQLGQVNGLVLVLVLADVLLLPPRWRGVLVGAAAGLKLTPLVMLLHFGARRQWGAVSRSLASFGATVAVGLLAMPSDSLQYWRSLIGAAERVGNPAFIDNQSVRGLVARLDLGHPGLVWLAASLVVVALGSATLHRLRHSDPAESMLVCLLVGLLISPISWSHHWVVLPAIGALLVVRGGPRDNRAVRVAGVLVLAVAVVGPHWLVPGLEHESGPSSLLGQVLGSSMVAVGALALVSARVLVRGVAGRAADRVLT